MPCFYKKLKFFIKVAFLFSLTLLHGDVFMAMTGAERQRKYRSKIKSETDRFKKKKRVNLLVSERAAFYLDVLATLHGDNKAKFLERLILTEYSRHSAALFDNIRKNNRA